MNIQNISAIAEQLQLLGFENLGYSLLKRICFKPDSFLLSKKIEEGKDRLIFQLCFKKDSTQNAYVLMYYDAILQKELTLLDVAVNGINTITLEKRMMEIDWKTAFEFDVNKQFSIEDKSSWEKEQKIESIVEDLELLSSTEEGKSVAANLKVKFWAGISNLELVGNVSPFNNTGEVSQRFYFFEGKIGITIDEAYRFLQNKWMEKQIQAKRKQTGDTNAGEDRRSSHPYSKNGLLKKKLLSKPVSDKKIIEN